MIYERPSTFLDVFTLSGRCIASFEMSKLIKEKISDDIQLTKLEFLLVPVLKWTGRRNKLPQSFGNKKQTFDTNKIILFGKIELGQTSRSCIMVFNMQTREIEKLKILSFIDDQEITSVAYGPFDNGHILIGLSDGWLLAYEYPSLERVESTQVFYNVDDSQSKFSKEYVDSVRLFSVINDAPD